jgi:hypothetical protein
MLKTRIPTGKINEMILAMQDLFDADSLDLGWRDFHRGRVVDLDTDDNSTEVRAQVKGKKTYDVRVRLHPLSASKCTCPAGSGCGHMAAVCFQIYAGAGRPEMLLQELKQLYFQRMRRSAASKTRVQKANEPAAQLPLGNHPVEWHKFFNQQFYGYSVTHPYAAENFYQAALEKLIGLSAKWREKHTKQLFQLHVLMFVLRKLNQFFTHNPTTYLSYHLESGCKKAAAECVDQLEQTLDEVDATTAAKIDARDMDQTADLVRQWLLSGHRQAVSSIDVYRAIWTKLLGQPERIQREVAKLNEGPAGTGSAAREAGVTSSSLHNLRRLALAHFQQMAGDDEEAMRRMEETGGRGVAAYVWYLNQYRKSEQWDRLHRWLNRLRTRMQDAKPDSFRFLCQCWQELTEHLGSDEEWVSVMRSLLPRSYPDYAKYLLGRGYYRQWVDLQIAHRATPANLHSEDLKKIEEADLQLLLPLYHQSAERLVLEKNRNSYKMAVRTLKKLKSCYRVLKQNEQWELFYDGFLHRYNRLRAFQEELAKEKLLP